MHPIIKALGNIDISNHEIKFLPKNSETFFCVSIDKFCFKDSLAFLKGSLADLTQRLFEGNHKFEYLRKSNLYQNDFQFQLLKKKGIYPYEAYKTHEELLQAKTLPPKKDFFSRLTNSHITDEEYTHAKTVFDSYKMKSMKEYTEYYCKLDCYLLSELLFQFRKIMFRNFHLDPLQTLTLSMYSYQAMLFKTKVKINYIKNLEIYEFIKSGIRGGLSFIGTRYQKKEEDSSFIYVDANNLVI